LAKVPSSRLALPWPDSRRGGEELLEVVRVVEVVRAGVFIVLRILERLVTV